MNFLFASARAGLRCRTSASTFSGPRSTSAAFTLPESSLIRNTRFSGRRSPLSTSSSTISPTHIRSRYHPASLWASYNVVLTARPFITRAVTAGILFTIGDFISQHAIERKSFGEHVWIRTARMSFYGTAIFAPLVYNWLRILHKVQIPGRPVATVFLRTIVDIGLWGPCIVAIFWTSQSVLEGLSMEDTYHKVSSAWFPSVQKSMMVFGPTQLINFWVVPAQYNMLFTQLVGLGWNIFLSYSNNKRNMDRLKVDQIGM